MFYTFMKACSDLFKRLTTDKQHVEQASEYSFNASNPDLVTDHEGEGCFAHPVWLLPAHVLKQRLTPITYAQDELPAEANSLTPLKQLKAVLNERRNEV